MNVRGGVREFWSVAERLGMRSGSWEGDLEQDWLWVRVG